MVSVHRVPFVGLLALLPVAVYVLSVDLIVAVALVNVVLITASVAAMFMPSESTLKASSA